MMYNIAITYVYYDYWLLASLHMSESRTTAAHYQPSLVANRVGVTIMRQKYKFPAETTRVAIRGETSKLWVYNEYLSWYLWMVFNLNNHSLQ